MSEKYLGEGVYLKVHKTKHIVLYRTVRYGTVFEFIKKKTAKSKKYLGDGGLSYST